MRAGPGGGRRRRAPGLGGSRRGRDAPARRRPRQRDLRGGAGGTGEGAPPGASEGSTEVLVVTGMSGAGRSTVADRLEDLGWYVVDNLPPQMLSALAGLAARARRGLPRVAVVLDVRGQEFFPEVQSALEELRDRGIVVRVLFLEASDEALVRRFESVRRPHPLQGEGRILDGIRAERDLVAALRGGADLLVDTSSLNVHELGARVGDVFGEAGRPRLRVTVMSFGFKYGIPVDADHVADVRFLPNPYWEPSLRAQTGRDEGVRDFVLRQEGAEEWLDRYVAALEPVVAGYRREHRGFVTVAVGCTGGKHRSVALSEQLARRLSGADVRARVVHRDLGRE
ncbi:RNase adapter RapZ [Pseudokineococcus marinus]|uniref:RNase adapter RapZ n=1 Tax=Pseudokineococcus marinus TaxID=351215 RepID=A0A849C026_9ACTN|nr:RNase adapter RapZ [Pseudokineococcus marinus]